MSDDEVTEITETVTRRVTDPSRGIFDGRRIPSRTLREMAASARQRAVEAELDAEAHRQRADMYEDVAAARERGEM